MQTQAQVPGQAPNQATRVQQNGSSVSSQSPNNIGGTFKKPWHTEGDVTLRRHVCEQILLLFKKRKPHVTPEWQQRLPDFVKRLEEALYLNAASKEEYSNTGTLEERLQSVAQRITPPKSQHGTGVMPTPGSVSTMMPTPGATMIPTPGSGGSMVSPGNGMNQIQTSGNGHVMSTTGTSGSKVVAPGSGGMMVPTPGIGSSLMQPTSNGNPMIQTPGSGHSIVQAPGLGGLIQGGTMATSGHGTNMTPATMSKLMQPSGHGNMFSNSGGNMLPTSGHPNAMANQQVFSGMRMSQNGQAGSGIGISQAGSQMIPTPGLPTSQSIGINPSSVGGLPMNNSGQQHYNGGSTPPGYRNLNGQLGPNLNGSVHRKGSQLGAPSMNNGIQMMGNGQHLNGGANIHNSSGYMNAAQFSNMQMQSSQGQQLRVNQQRHPQMRMQGDGYPLSQADINGSGSLYPAASSAGLVGANMNLSSQPSKMIPVPGLPPQQGMIQQQPSPQQLHIQRTALQQNMTRNQQLPMQMTKTQSMFQQQTSNIGGQKQQGVMDQSQQASFQHATSEQHQGLRTHMPSQQHAQVPSLQRQGVQPSLINHQHLRQQQPQRTQQQQQMQLKQNQPQQSTQLQTHKQQQQQPQGQSLSHSQAQGQAPQMQQSQMGQMLHHQPPDQQQQVQQQVQVQHQQQLGQPQQLQQLQSQAQAQQTHQALMQRQQQPQQQVPRSFAQASQVLQRSQMLQQGSLAQHQHSGGVHLQQQTQPQSQLQPSSTAASSPSLGNVMVMPSDNASNGNLSGNANGPPMQGNETTDVQRAQQYVKQRRWLLFLRHASKCQAPEGQCQTTPHCHVARQLWSHLSTCKQERDCTYTRCTASRTLVRHYQQCREPRCPVCAPVRQILSSQNRAQASGAVQPGQSQPATTSPQISGQVGSVGSPGLPLPQSGASPITGMSALSPQMSTPLQGIEGDMNPPPAKRVKLESSGVQVSQQQSLLSSKAQLISSVSAQQNQMSRSQGVKPESHAQVKMEIERSGPHSRTDTQVGAPAQRQKHHTLGPKGDLGGQASGSHIMTLKSEPGVQASKQQQGNSAFPAPTTAMLSKSGKPKIVGTSLIELFTPEQIREHITGLRQWVGQSKAKAEKNQAMEQKMTDNSCHLCAVERLTFEPPPIYCTACGARIKRNSAFYTLAAGETRHYCCTACYNECRTDSVEMDGTSYPKVKLEKRRNDEETEEAWVQCDKCNLWQHQVCALFNGRRNEGGEAEYTCPQCLAAEMERGERKPLPPSAVLGAKDMPKTLLSDHLETRLARKLDAERHQRAVQAGKSKEEVPGAEALVVRVVSSVDKKLEVKQRFMEMFQDEDYPTEFPYKSKVVLLFQKIEGVEVCLFGMYVQEFGVDSAHPNQRRVYLSYLDSVKYFRPDVKTASGEALRTFVYHEILIGYLEHCKKRGFSSCYIWACPPLKGEDYILYCHPEIQKTPKSDKLREWYLTMLRKAAKESIVVEVTNLYDYFFTATGESKAKVTAARLPYFDGDYWPGAAEDMILQLQQEEEDGRKLQKKGKTKKATTTKRNAKVAGQAELPTNASDDSRLMYKLGESILPMKEDFIMVHMHHSCAHCRTFIVTGQLWSCQSCTYFKLCNRCYEIEQKVDERERHRGTSKDAHVFEAFHISDVATDTKDKDEIMESEFFDTRQAFLSLCQGNHYQYDTLRRAKHSSMMVLYHLHNPTAPAFVATCNSCNRDIDTGQGWRCETCVDFDLCNTCKESVTHEHKLVLHSERNAQNKEARQMRVLQLRKMLELLVHASQCALQSQCDYPKCHSVKALFRHGMYCTVRASGGCALCKRMWYLLQLHARACKEAVCRVPRCKDLKEHLRRLTHQAESRRRAAVNEMMRQRAAEAAGNTG